MRLYTFNNGMTLDLDKIESISNPSKSDPYNKTYGEVYYIRMISGVAHEAYQYVYSDAPSWGNIIMYKEDLIKLIEEKA